MIKHMKRLLSAALILSCTILLTGCMGAINKVTIHEDGSADATYSVGFTEEMLEYMKDSEDYNEEEMLPFEYNGVTYYGESDTQHFATLDEYLKEFEENAETAEAFQLTCKDDVYTLTVDLTANFEEYGKEAISGADVPAGGEKADENSEELDAMFEELFGTMAFISEYTFPYPVHLDTKPLDGVTISGNTVTFDMVAMSEAAKKEPDLKELVFTIKQQEIHFDDVKETDYFFAPVYWALENKITDGTSAVTFSPNKECTRAHVLTFLWRAAGCPEAPQGIETTFYGDMKAGQYYCDPISWAYSKGIATGLEPHTFGVDTPITRGEFVTYLWKAAGSPEPIAAENVFTDVPTGTESEKAILWAKEAGVTDGTSPTTFSPDRICTRAHVITFLNRYYGK